MGKGLTHLNERGEAHIVDIAGKAPTLRRAVAQASLEASPETIAAIIGGIMPLLSGLAMTTAVRDTVYGDLISGMTRALEALLLAAAVAMGVYVGLKFAAMMGGIAL